MKFNHAEIKDIEKLQKCERIFAYLLKKDNFTKPDIWKCGESKQLIGRIVNGLISEGALIEKPKRLFEWISSQKERYRAEWLDRPISTHQLKRLSKEDRPREKLLKYGADKLTDAELLAILLRTGTRGKSAIEMAQEIIKSAGSSFRGLAGKEISEITKISGIKEAKVITVAAALEIARRISKQILKEKGVI